MDHLRKISTISCIELQRRGKICRFLKIKGAMSGLVVSGISADGLNNTGPSQGAAERN